MRKSKAVAAAMVAALCVCATASAAQAANTDNRVVDATKRIAGFSSGELFGELLRQHLALPNDVNPQKYNGNFCLSAGAKDKVLLLYTVTTSRPAPVCAVKPGTPIFFYAFGGECSNVEPAPFFGATEAEQRACILGFVEQYAAQFQRIVVRIDGGAPVVVSTPRFLTSSPQVHGTLPEENILDFVDTDGEPPDTSVDVHAGPIDFVAGGYVVQVRPLPPGRHTITVSIVGGAFAGTNQAIIDVVPGLKA